MEGLRSLRLRPADSAGEEIQVEHLPGRGPTLVFLHGMTSARWGSKSAGLMARAQAAGLGFACFDFRAHGDSDGELAGLTVSNLVEDVAALVAEFGPCVLCGSSMGALAAAWFAARSPEAVPALALLSPALGFIPKMAAHAGRPEPFPLVRSDEAVVHLEQATLEDARRFDERRLPELLGMPLFMAHGTEDRTVPAALSEAFFAAVPQADKELWLIEGGSHSLSEDVDTLLDNLMDFLARQQLV